MVFSSSVFLYYFLPAFMVVYRLTPPPLRAGVIAVGSFVFYGWSRPEYVLLMAVSTGVDWIAARRIDRARARGRRGTTWLWFSLTVNLGLLGWFKYAGFVSRLWNDAAQRLGLPLLSPIAVALPVGISFYTFQTMSYTIDVWRGEAKPAGRLRDFACYVSLFPQLVAGPIVRWSTVAASCAAPQPRREGLFRGVLLFQLGLAKKILLADTVASLADDLFAGGNVVPAAAWLGVAAYSLQIYFDFSGYSDMAIGLGLMLGFEFPVNFDRPYASESITEFWRRWHISLSTWLRDYLYIPLGGNRRGRRRTHVNLMITMLLGGLWHGAALNFVAWGAWHGLWLGIDRLGGGRAPWSRAPKVIRRAATLIIVLLGWVLFRAGSLTQALQVGGMMFGVKAAGGQGLVLPSALSLLAALSGVFLAIFGRTSQELVRRPSRLLVLSAQFLFLVSLVHLHSRNHVPFLYYQF